MRILAMLTVAISMAGCNKPNGGSTNKEQPRQDRTNRNEEPADLQLIDENTRLIEKHKQALKEANRIKDEMAAQQKREFELLPKDSQNEVFVMRAVMKKRPIEELPKLQDDDVESRKRRIRLTEFVPKEDLDAYRFAIAAKYGLIEHFKNLKIGQDAFEFKDGVQTFGLDPSDFRKDRVKTALAISRKVKAANGSFANLTDKEKEFVREEIDLFPAP